jgi:hypothetical protein
MNLWACIYEAADRLYKEEFYLGQGGPLRRLYETRQHYKIAPSLDEWHPFACVVPMREWICRSP